MSWGSAFKQRTVQAAAAEVRGPFLMHVPMAKINLAKVVTVDFETYFDADYTLRKLNTSTYVRHDLFKAHMAGIKIGNRPTKIYSGAKLEAALKAIDWSTHALLCHNTAFDGLILSHHFGVVPHLYLDTLSMARGLHGNDIGASLDEVAHYYGVGNKIPNVLGTSKGVRDLDKATYTSMASYCAEDVRLTFEIFKQMLLCFPAKELRLVHHTISMFCDPILKVDIPRVATELAREIKAKEDLLISVSGIESDLEQARKVIASNESFAQLLIAEGVAPPTKISPTTKKQVYAFAKTDLDFTSLSEHPSERVRNLVDARLAVKSTIGETRAERFLEAGKNGWSLPVLLNYYGAHCVPGDTEVLTQNGWERIDRWQGGTIAQVTPERRIDFLPAERFVGPETTEWLEVDAPYLKCGFTLGHTMPYLSHGAHEWRTEQAGVFAGKKMRYVPVSGELVTTGVLRAEELRVAAMMQADGSFEEDTTVGRRATVFVKKPRKIARARQLLTHANIPFYEQTYDSHPGFVRFIVAYRDYPEWFGPHLKTFGPWLLDSALHARQQFVKELVFWDGWAQGGKNYYCTTVKNNAEWVQTLAHLIGISANITEKIDSRDNRQPLYIVGFRARDHIVVRAKHMRKTQKVGATYCTITQTGFWLARRNGHIFITGNTGRWSAGNKMNMQNLPRGGELRLSILAPRGNRLVVADSGQIEARVNAWISEQDDLLAAFAAQSKDSPTDVYTKFASTIYGREITKADNLERFIGKIAVLGLGYSMGAPKLQATLALGTMGPAVFLELDLCKKIVNLYRRMNFKIAAFWKRCEAIIDDMITGTEGSYKCLRWEKECLWLPNGMRLKYPGLRCDFGENGFKEYTYQRKGITTKIYGGLLCENIVQALARIVIGEQLLELADGYKYRIATTTHDELVACVKTAQAKKCFKDMWKVMTTPPDWCSELPLSAEGGWAENYSK